MKRYLLWALILVVVALVVFFALRPTPVVADLAEATRGPLRVTVEEEGQTRVRERYVLSAPAAGELQRVHLENGDEVEQDAVVATLLPAAPTPLDPRTRAELEQRLQAAEASVRTALASRDFARSELRRQQRLAESGALARRDLENAQLQAESAARQVDEARALANSLRAQLGRGQDGDGRALQIRSPVRGRVLRLLQESRAVVGPGTPILEVGDPADLEIVTDLLSEEAVEIRVGAKVEIDRWGGPSLLEGRVLRVEPSAYTKISALGVEEQRVDVITELLAPPEKRRGLGDRYRVYTRIVTSQSDDALTIPTGALFREGSEWRVFVVEEGVAHARSVRIGRQNDERVEILEGLQAGSRVVVYPGDRLEEGKRVRAR